MISRCYHKENTVSIHAVDWGSLHFEGRQVVWKGDLRTFRQLHGRNDRATVWEIWVDGSRYFTRHGLLGGQMQETSKLGKAKNQGKANAISPEQDALAEARRLCRKKWDFEGYDEFVGEVNIDNRTGKPSIPHLLASLPGNFSLYKPVTSMDDSKAMTKKAAEGKILYSLKRNGLATWVVVDAHGNINIYSRRNRPYHKNEGPTERPDGTLDYSTVVPLATRYPHLVDSVRAMKLPPNTMLACELVNLNGDSKADFAHVTSVEKSLTTEAIEKQAERGWLALYCWDIPFWDGEDWVSTVPVTQRYQKIYELLAANAAWILPIQYSKFPSPETAKEYAKQSGLEGFVAVDPQGIYGDKGWNLKGKPDRPRDFCVKVKPWYEDDFIVMWDPAKKHGTFGKGRHEKGKQVKLPNGNVVEHGGVGSMGLFQLNSKKELVYICDCPGGGEMDYEFQAQLRPESFPFVAEVKFVDRSYIADGDDTNALTFPGFVRVHPDKEVSEIINEKLDPVDTGE
jgi:hypothetical protein